MKDNLFSYAQGPDFQTVGIIKELSLNGATYEYLNEGLAHDDRFAVTIFNSILKVKGIECRVVYDAPVESTIPFSQVPMKRCSVHFENLTKEQSEQLSSVARWFSRK